jgi:hypothetical protein
MVPLSAGGAVSSSRVEKLRPSLARFRGAFGRTSATAAADDDDATPAEMPAGVPGADALAPIMGVGDAAAAPAAVAEACPGVELWVVVSVELGANGSCAQVTAATASAAEDVQAGSVFPPTAATVSFASLSGERMSKSWPAAS